MKKFFSLPISIHCWGGLGSQIFTWVMAEKIARKYPHKKIKLVLHSNGVTERLSSIDFLSNKYQIDNVNDFQINAEGSSSVTTLRLGPRKFLLEILLLLGFISHANTNDEYAKIRRWTLILRGHYSYQTIEDEVIQEIIQQYRIITHKVLGYQRQSATDISIHYRLGDLLSLSNKSYVDPITLSKEIARITQERKSESVNLYSDSPSEAKNMLIEFLPETQIIATELEIWETLSELVACKYFIGTNSKISIWVALFRKSQNSDSHISLPKTMKEEIERISPKISSTPNFAYYG